LKGEEKMTGLIIIMGAVIACLIVVVIVYHLNLKATEKDVEEAYDLLDREILSENFDRAIVYNAYEALTETLHKKKVTKSEMGQAMEEAIGYLGAVLDDHREDEEDV
jgi:uncharacterized protein YpmB